MDLNRLNPTQYMWIITKTNKPLGGLAPFGIQTKWFWRHLLSEHGGSLD
jgi:hypothetical protein